LKKLRADVKEEFITKGEHRDAILMQDMIEVNGNFTKAPIVGAIGGLLGQFILCFSAIHKKWKKELMGDPSDPNDAFLSHRVV
jgi:hypothetical protein